MRKIVHQAAGLGMAAVCYSTGAPIELACGILFGCTAPDWMEVPIWREGVRFSLIPHRTITHWLLLWVIALTLLSVAEPSPLIHLASGFVMGGILHVLQDAVTPMGVPLILPRRVRLPDFTGASAIITLLVSLLHPFMAHG